MSLERRSPLPVATYWVDVFQPEQAAFREWLAKYKEEVEVINTESFPAKGLYGYEARDWYLFNVVDPVPWDWEGRGFPDIAESQEITADDTVHRPPPTKGPIEALEETIIEAPEAAAKIVTGAVVVGGVGLALYFLATRKGK